MPHNSIEALILQRLDRIDDKLDTIRVVDIPSLRTDVAGLKLKAGIIAAAVGLVVPIAASLVF